MATSKGTMFDPTLVKDLITKVKGKRCRSLQNSWNERKRLHGINYKLLSKPPVQP